MNNTDVGSFTATPVTNNPVRQEGGAVQGIPRQQEQVAAPKSAPTPAPAPQDPMAPKLGMLARKEKALVERQKALAAEQAQYQAQRTEWEKQQTALSEKEKLWKEDPLKALELFGHSYQSLTERVLANGEPTPNMLKQEIEALRKEQQQLHQQRIEQEKQRAAEQEAATIQSYKDELKEFVNAKKDDFKLVGLFDTDAGLVYDTIEEYYNQTGKILSHEEAASKVDSYFRQLVDQANGVMKPGIAFNEKPRVEQLKQEERQPKPAATTLSNQMNTVMAATTLPARTESERIRRAMAALDGAK